MPNSKKASNKTKDSINKKKRIQKCFYYSSDEAKKFIEGEIKKIAVKTHRSDSAVIEYLLLYAISSYNDDKEMKNNTMLKLEMVDLTKINEE